MNTKQQKTHPFFLPSAGEIVSLAGAGEDDDGDLRVAEDRKLVGLLHQPVASLGESDLATVHILNLLYLYPSSPHL